VSLMQRASDVADRQSTDFYSLDNFSPSLQESISLNLSTPAVADRVTTNISKLVEKNPTREANLSAMEQTEQTPRPTFDEQIAGPEAETNVNRASIEAAVSLLAKQQQAEIEKLMEQQAREREELRALFKRQQEQLVEEVMSRLKSGSLEEKKIEPEAQTESAQTTETTSDEVSLKMTPDTHDKGGSTSPLIPTVAMHLRPESRQLPEGFAFPEEVYTDANRRRLDKLTAMAKGHLTRKLLKTDKVQSIVNSMRDTMTIALQLHSEAKSQQRPAADDDSSSHQQMARAVTLQDVELHRRLLQQLYKDSVAFHNIFFSLTPAEKVSIIRLDRSVKADRRSVGQRRSSSSDQGEDAEMKKLSAVTRSRMEQKKQLQQLLIENNFNKPQTLRSLVKSAEGRRSQATNRVERKTRSLGSQSTRGVGSSPFFRTSPRAAGATSGASTPAKKKRTSAAARPWK